MNDYQADRFNQWFDKNKRELKADYCREAGIDSVEDYEAFERWVDAQWDMVKDAGPEEDEGTDR